MKRYLRWIVAAEFLLLNRRQINQALLSTGDLAHDEF